MTALIPAKVEMAFGARPLLDASPTWTDITSYVQTIDTNRGNAPTLGSFASGTATIVCKNNDYRFDPDNVSGPYSGDLMPLTRIRISVTNSSATTKYLFNGYVAPLSGFVQNYGETNATTTINCVDFLAVLATFHLPPTVTMTTWTSSTLDTLQQLQQLNVPVTITLPAPTYPAYRTGALLTQLVSDGTFPQPVAGWSVDTTYRVSQGYLGADNALSWVQTLAATEGGDVYVLATGVARFDGRYSAITVARMSTSQATFDDAPGATIPYSAAGFSKTYCTEMYNSVTVTPDGGTPVTEVIQPDIDAFTQSDYSKSGFFNSSADAIADAKLILAQYSTPTSSPAAIVVKPRRSNAVKDAVLDRELRDRVTVKRKPPGASAQVSADVFISSIAHHLTAAGEWDCTMQFRSAQVSPFTTASSSYAVYGTSTFSGGKLYAY